MYQDIDMNLVKEYFFSGAEDLLDAESAEYVMIEPKENYAVTTVSSKSAELRDVLSEEMEAILNDQKSVKDGLADAAARGDKILAE